MTRRHWLGFFALCLLSASSWLVEAAWPSLMSSALRGFLHDAVIAFVVGIFGWSRLARNGFSTTRWAKLAVASMCLFAIPATLVETTRSGVTEGTIAALFALLPVAVVLLLPYFDLGERTDSSATGLLAPALVGLAGTLLLLPFALPATFREVRLYAVVVLAVLIAASASVWMYRLLVDVAVVQAVVISCVANATFLLAMSLASNAFQATSSTVHWSRTALGVEALKAVCLDMPQIVLLLWLMREIAPERLAARAFIVPLLTVLEGYVLLRPAISLRSVCGAALLVFAAWRLLGGSRLDEEPRLMLR